jgi:rhodanese-related sulfurtransferase
MKNRILFTVFAIALMFAFTACNNAADDKQYGSADEMVSFAKENITSISIDEFHTEFAEAEHLTIVDVREPEEFAISCIPGAINVPRGVLEFSIGDKVSRGETVYVYCNNTNRSALAVYDMAKLKYSKAVMIDSGFDVWQEKYPEDVQLEPSGSEENKPAAPAGGGGCGG